MVLFKGVLTGFIAIVVSISSASLVQAETWDLGYTNAAPEGVEAEEIPDSINDPRADAISVSDDGVADASAAVPAASPSSSFTKISTAKNTYGVETVEKPGLQIFLSPVAGFTSVLGNSTVEVAPQYAVGGRVGLLVSDNMMIEGGYTYAVMNTSGALQYTNTNQVLGNANTNVFVMKQNVVDAGVKLFFLGRESRFRPFIGGALAYANSTLNYFVPTNSADFKIKQFQGAGQLGAEFAFTRAFVATAAFRLSGSLSSSDSLADANSSTTFDANKAAAGNSLSRSASYSGTVGLGVYF